MILMALDHVSLFWNSGRRSGEGLMGSRPDFPNFTQFILRFVTHYCAPTFIFLAGTSLALSTAKRLSSGRTRRDISLHMIKRGGFLLLLTPFVEAPAFGSSPIYFGVLACIGSCFIIFSLLYRLPPKVILALSILMIVAHPFLNLDWIMQDSAGSLYLRVVLHEPRMDTYPYVGLYPIIPWLGVMGLGWCFGVFLSNCSRVRIRKLTPYLAASGLVSLTLWFVVRFFNGFGNLLPRLGWPLEDWLYMSKYPPDLAFLLWTLGGMCFFLALGNVLQDRHHIIRPVTEVIHTFGRTPLFFYLVHLWLYRLRPGWVTRPPFYLDLATMTLFWALGLLVLWRLCLRFEKLKKSFPNSLLQYI